MVFDILIVTNAFGHHYDLISATHYHYNFILKKKQQCHSTAYTHTHTLIHIRIKELELYPAANSSNPVKNTGIKKKKKNTNGLFDLD